MAGCEGYEAIAHVYDKLNADIDYSAWADFVERCFDRFLPRRPELVLDLACGTGSMTLELAKRGYDMIGVDGSADMLSEAFSRAIHAPSVLWLNQDMRAFELYGTVGAITCCLDSLNYLLSSEDLSKCFACVHNYLDPGGLFLFDMNTPYKFRNVYGSNAYILEDELVYGEEDADEERVPVFCGWQNTYHPETRICDFDLSLFEEMPDGSYRRSDEHQQERCYELEEIRTALRSANLELIGVWSDFDFSTPDDTTERWYFAARAVKS
ncbi:MAG: class I SAM-dependent methyltransferase [Clostridia bacterium]|nr:class I SAM-dependent methyltransferase [Clostridia bacterium]